MGGLAVYVTSHGFGHLNRAVAVINRLPASLPVAIRCHADLFGHWRERLTRPADLGAYVSDAGAFNPPGDSAATDGKETLARAERVHAEAMRTVDAEVSWLKESGVHAVLSDAPPVPLVAARRAGIPGTLLANFTWADIYAPHARAVGGNAPRFVAEVRAAYRQATTLFHARPSVRMAGFGRGTRVVDVGMVVTPGRRRGRELRKALGLSAKEKVVYFYIGRYGQANLGWHRLARLGAKGVHFVGFHAAPPEAGPIANLHVVPADAWNGADLTASADAVVAKAGYGTVCEAMVAGTPIVYPPRGGFAEHRTLDRALRDWGGGVPMPARAFQELRLDGPLTRAFALKPGAPPFPTDGAAKVARELTSLSKR